MDGEMPDYLLAKDLILQVSLTGTSGISFILMGQNMSTYVIYYVSNMDPYMLFCLLIFYWIFFLNIYVCVCVCVKLKFVGVLLKFIDVLLVGKMVFHLADYW